MIGIASRLSHSPRWNQIWNIHTGPGTVLNGTLTSNTEQCETSVVLPRPNWYKWNFCAPSNFNLLHSISRSRNSHRSIIVSAVLKNKCKVDGKWEMASLVDCILFNKNGTDLPHTHTASARRNNTDYWGFSECCPVLLLLFSPHCVICISELHRIFDLI